jgi:ubiquitin-activating enzyme E1
VEEYSDNMNINTILSNQKVSVVVGCTCSFKELKILNSVARKHSIPFVAARVFNSCGFVFNDFGDNFEISDVDGESYKEVSFIIATVY